MAKVYVLGSLNMDMVVQMKRAPLPGETVFGEKFFTAAGGKGANQAVAASRLGARTSMIGAVGKDNFGELLIKGLNESKVDTSLIKKVPGSSGVALITLDSKGGNSIVVVSGANSKVTGESASQALKSASKADVLAAQLEIPLETVFKSFLTAKNRKALTVLNAAPARKLPASLLKLTDLLIVNETEAKMLANPKRKLLLPDLARTLKKLGPSEVIITLGGKGAVHCDKKGECRNFPAYKVKPLDTTAAGDAFVGGIISCMAKGFSILESMPFASACGALATTRYGAQDSLPTLSEVKGFLKNITPA